MRLTAQFAQSTIPYSSSSRISTITLSCDGEFQRWCKQTLSVESEGEDEIASTLSVALPLFPQAGGHHAHLARKNRRSFDSADKLLPTVMASLRPLSLLPQIRAPRSR
jgi:hypothetical protein